MLLVSNKQEKERLVTSKIIRNYYTYPNMSKPKYRTISTSLTGSKLVQTYIISALSNIITSMFLTAPQSEQDYWVGGFIPP